MKKVFFLNMFVFFNWYNIFSQNIIPDWSVQDSIGGERLNYNLILIDSTDNTVVVCGETYSPGPIIGMVTTKYNMNGEKLWSRYYDTFAQDIVADAQTDQDGSVYVGLNSTNPFVGGAQFLVFKYAANGDSLWRYYYQDSTVLYTYLTKLLITPEQNLILFGNYGTLDDSGLLAVCINQDGTKLWELKYNEGTYGYSGLSARMVQDRIVTWSTHGSQQGSRFFCWQFTANGMGIETGETTPYSDYFGDDYYVSLYGDLYIGDAFGEYKLNKYLKSGQQAWTYKKPYKDNPNGVDARLEAIVVDDLNEVFVGGVYYYDLLGIVLPLFSKIDESGQLIWEKMLIDSTYQSTTPNTVIQVGSMLLFSGVFGKDIINNTYETFVYKTNKMGNEEKFNVVDLYGDKNYGMGIVSNQNNLIIGGTSTFIMDVYPYNPNRLFVCKFTLNDFLSQSTIFSKIKYAKITPNPVDDDFTLSFNHQEKGRMGTVRVFSAVGKVVHQQNHHITPGENSILVSAISHLSSGVYTVQLSVGDLLYVAKVLKP
jgi:hypothetical protein